MSTRKPMVLVMAGPNGSGKSTITQYFEKVGKYTNADEMVLSTGMKNEEAAVKADESRYESIEKKEDFTFEPVRIIRKHKEEFSIFPNEIWSEDDIQKLLS